MMTRKQFIALLFAILVIAGASITFGLLKYGKKHVAEEFTADPRALVQTDDQDRDGITDTREAEIGTSNRDFDTDHDGLADADELTWKTDPTKEDTDGDGFGDAMEIISGYNPTGAGKLEIGN